MGSRSGQVWDLSLLSVTNGRIDLDANAVQSFNEDRGRGIQNGKSKHKRGSGDEQTTWTRQNKLLKPETII